MADMAKVIVVIEGGVCQSVFSSDKDVDVELIDWDNLDQQDDPELEAKYKELQKQTEKMFEVF